MQKIHISRLEKLATFLETHRFTKDKAWDFHQWHQSLYGGEYDITRDLYDENAIYDEPCGTSACAIGWCPVVFPRSWFLDRGMPHMKSASTDDPEMSGIIFFGLCEAEFEHIFAGQTQQLCFTPKGEKPIRLGLHAPAKRVAKNMRQFLRFKSEEKASKK